MYVKKETGEEVTDAYAKRYPHLVKKVREPKVVKAPVEDAPIETSEDAAPPAFVPVIGDKFELNGEVLELTSLDLSRRPCTDEWAVYRRPMTIRWIP